MVQKSIYFILFKSICYKNENAPTFVGAFYIFKINLKR